MAKIKLTKGELKRQRDSLKQFRRYLPTLQLKKQQLQMKITEARKYLAERRQILQNQVNDVEKWCGVLADPGVDITEWITPVEVMVDKNNVAGAVVPVFDRVQFKPPKYDFFLTPFWIDDGIKEIRRLISLLVEVDVIKQGIAVLEKELRTTTQRVNLFEKVKIPECLENIRKIGIYLGDLQANAVGISKVAKKKIEEKSVATASV